METAQFLSDGGEMGERIRTYNWSNTPVGSIENWPQSLKTTLSIIINSKFPMFLWWGNDLIQFYNDAYRKILGVDGRHPFALGQTAEECWPEVWNSISPLINQVLHKGESVYIEDLMLQLYRNGNLEDAYWTFGYSPVKDETGNISGVIVVCTENTQKVEGYKRLKESEELLSFAIESTELGTWDLNPITNKFTGNGRLKEWFGLNMEDEIELPTAANRIVEKYRQEVNAAIVRAITYPGEKYEIEYAILNPKTKKERIVLAKGKAWFNENKIAYRFNGTLQDITERALARQLEIERENYFKNLTDTVPSIIWTTRADGYCTFLNKKWYEYTGQTVEEATGFGWLNATHPDDMRETEKAFLNANEKQEYFSVSYRLKNKEGDYRWVMDRAMPKFNDLGVYEGLAGTVVDIHEQKVAEKKIEESELNLRNTISKAPVAMCIFKGENHVVEIVNDKMLEFWGKAEAQVLGRPFFEGLPEVKGQGFESLLDRVFTTGETINAYEVPAMLPRNNGAELTYVDFVYEAYREIDGTVSGIIAVATEVTQQVLARKKIEKAEEKVRLAIESADLGSYEVDLLTNRMTTSERFDAIWGGHSTYRSELASYIHPEDLPIRNEAHRKSIETGVLEYEARLLRKDKSSNWVRIKGKLIYDQNHNPISLIGVIQDITAQKQFAEQLTKLVKERTLELHRSNEDLLQFAHVASHDLKEPVRKIKIFSSMLQNDYGKLLPERGMTYLNKIHNATDRMFSMIEGVLAYSEFTSAEQKNDVISLNKIIENIESDLELLIQQQNATIIKDDLPEIEGAGVLIHQLFYNLINNALKFSKKEVPTVIEISSSFEKSEDASIQMVKIVITDNGIGIDPKLSGKIFDVFSRLNAKDDYEGTGLGLALCKKIVERHHGTIEATGVKDVKAVFSIFLPQKQNIEII